MVHVKVTAGFNDQDTALRLTGKDTSRTTVQVALQDHVHTPVRKTSTCLRHLASSTVKATNLFSLFSEQVTIYFLKDLMSGTKTPIYGPDVRHVTIPQYEGLGIQDIANFVNTRANVLPFLPDGKELSKTPKQWIGNVCASVLKNVFTDWIKAQVETRNEKLVVDRGLTISMDPKIAAIFNASTKTSGTYSKIIDRLIPSFPYSAARLRSPHAQGGLET